MFVARKAAAVGVAASLLAPLFAAVVTTAAVVVSTTATPAGAASGWSITAWGTLTPLSGTPESDNLGVGGNSMNGAGDAVGSSTHSQPAAGPPVQHPVIFKGGTLTDLGPLHATDTAAAYGLNNHDVVVGAESSADGELQGPPLPVEWSNGTATQLGGGLHGYATAVNDGGTIVGYLVDGSGNANEAVQFNADGSVTDLGTLLFGGGNGRVGATAINNSGAIVGGATDSSGHLVAAQFFKNPTSAGPPTLAIPLPKLAGATDNVADAISEQNGNIVGDANGGQFIQEAVQFGPGQSATDLGRLPGDKSSNAQAVNSNDVAVGYSIDPTANSRAVMFIGGVVHDLNSMIPAGSGWTLQEATGINDNDVIVGTGTLNGVREGFTLTPPVRQLGQIAQLFPFIPLVGGPLAGLILLLDGLLKLNL